MTPLDKAKEILDDIAGSVDGLPALRYAQIGTAVVGCEVFTVAVSGISPHGDYGPIECNPSQLSTFVITVALDCSWVANADGTDDPALVIKLSERMDKLSQDLWDWAAGFEAYLSKEWTMAMSRVSGLAMVVLSLTTGVD